MNGCEVQGEGTKETCFCLKLALATYHVSRGGYRPACGPQGSRKSEGEGKGDPGKCNRRMAWGGVGWGGVIEKFFSVINAG